MKRKQAKSSMVDTGLSEQSINALYGLEPVFEPGTININSTEPIQFLTINCPYCGEPLVTSIDLSAGACSYVEDCQVCCQPMELSIELDDAGEFQALQVRRLD
ncbi:MAG: CPXCG motif-containing cysteine-rich protein [Steroidobacteraceae bacterium]